MFSVRFSFRKRTVKVLWHPGHEKMEHYLSLLYLLFLITGLCNSVQFNLNESKIWYIKYSLNMHTNCVCRRQLIGSVLLKMQGFWFLEVGRFYSHVHWNMGLINISELNIFIHLTHTTMTETWENVIDFRREQSSFNSGLRNAPRGQISLPPIAKFQHSIILFIICNEDLFELSAAMLLAN